MAPYVLDSQQKSVAKQGLVYDLHGVINHYGELNYGHYIACAKNSITGQWNQFNDSQVSQIETSPEELVTDAAYVLFYKLRGFEDSVGVVDND